MISAKLEIIQTCAENGEIEIFTDLESVLGFIKKYKVDKVESRHNS